MHNAFIASDALRSLSDLADRLKDRREEYVRLSAFEASKMSYERFMKASVLYVASQLLEMVNNRRIRVLGAASFDVKLGSTHVYLIAVSKQEEETVVLTVGPSKVRINC
jgi:hydroxylamine reductase (hybrid-cluster protein)